MLSYDLPILKYGRGHDGKRIKGQFVVEKSIASMIAQAILRVSAEEGWSEESVRPILERGIRLEWSKKEEFGDLSTPFAMGLSKELGKPPRAIDVGFGLG